MELGEILKLLLIDLQALFRSRVRDQNLTLTQIMVISSIPTEGIDMTSLARRLAVDTSTITRLIDVLLKRGWVVKQKNPKDKRSTLVKLAQEGQAIQERIEDKIDRFGEEINQEIHYEDRAEMKEVLTSLHWIISKLKL
ncbi:MAG: MarR family transcriptional regulator [Candidatus Neomarinimicrobiota bacterium]